LTVEAETRSTGDGTILILLKGFMIGIANIIPGVSGGTFALILGLFDRMIAALHSIGGRTVAACFGLLTGGFGPAARSDFAQEWRRIDAWFLLRMLIGALLAIFLCGELIKWLLQDHPGITLAFFLGLIVPSLAVPWVMMGRRGPRQLFWVLPGIAVTVGLCLAFGEPAAEGGHPFGVELLLAVTSGAIAISAMILPGISGSFVLLVVGQYPRVLEHLSGARQFHLGSVLWLVSMALGCALGLLLFSRLLHWLLHRWRSGTMAFLIGLVLGSFFVLWPFKDFEAGRRVEGRNKEVKRGIQVATAPHQWPQTWGETGKNGLAFLLGLGGAVGVELMGRRSRKPVEREAESPAPGAGE